MALNPDRGKMGGDHLETSEVWFDQIKMKGKWKSRDKRWRFWSEVTLLNKVTEGERNELRQSDRRYEEHRRSDSLKRYKGMFDFLCPKLSAL